MIDGLQMVTDVRALINVPGIIALLEGGKIYPDTRPPGRTDKTDIVVNSIGINNLQMQKGTPNINIYAPNLPYTQEDGTVTYLPNYFKFQQISRDVIFYVDGQYSPTFNTKVTDPGTLLQDPDGQYFLSIQLSYQAVQINYQHI